MVDVPELKPRRGVLSAIPSGVWALGFVSLFMDLSSEMIHSLLPIYMVTVLGTSALSVGVIEGIAEATAQITKVFSGVVSDWLGKRKLLILLGYGMAALTKPVFPLAPTVGWLIGARFLDRVGKGIRGAPRDALIADISPPDIRGASFGLRQSLDTVGAFMGPSLALLLMWWTSNSFSAVFWIAVIPAFISVAIVLLGVREPEPSGEARAARFPLRRDELVRLSSTYWLVVAVSALFTLARFSEAFLLLDAQRKGMDVTFVPIVLIGMNVVYAISAAPVGLLADRIDRTTLLAIGTGLLATADVILAITPGYPGLAAGIALWGLHMGFTQGVVAALIADAAPPKLRGTAFGIFNLVTGLSLLAASVLAGILWDGIGPAATFLCGAALALASGVSLLPLRRSILPKRKGT